jgi:hypothetical protein
MAIGGQAGIVALFHIPATSQSDGWGQNGVTEKTAEETSASASSLNLKRVQRATGRDLLHPATRQLNPFISTLELPLFRRIGTDRRRSDRSRLTALRLQPPPGLAKYLKCKGEA